MTQAMPSPLVRSLAALFFSLTLFLPGSASAQRLPGDVVPRHYEIRLEPDLATGALSGRETIAVEVLRPTASVVLHALGLELSEVTVAIGDERRPATVALDPARETARLALAAPLPVGEARIEIAFSGRLGEGLRGLYSGSHQAAGGSRRYAVTQFQATYARMAFPCFDEPAYKATFDLTRGRGRGRRRDLERPRRRGRDPVQRRASTRSASRPRRRCRPICVALAVGDFDCAEAGGEAACRSASARRRARRTLGRVRARRDAALRRCYERYFGIPYPFGKLDIVAVPDFEAGAMENTAAIFYRERSAARSTRRRRRPRSRRSASPPSSPTRSRTSGSATWSRWRGGTTSGSTRASPPGWREGRSGPGSRSGTSGVEAEASAGSRGPTPARHAADPPGGETPAEINELFDAISYQKAPPCCACSRLLGRGAVPRRRQRLPRGATQGNATSEDFWSELARVSGGPVDRVLASFIDQPGLPLVAGEARCVDGKTRVALTQRQFFQDPGLLAAGSPEVWTVPVCLRPGGARGAGLDRSEPRCELLAERERTVELPGCAPWVLLDAGARGFYRSAYFGEALAQISAAAAALPPAEQVALLDDQWALVRAGRTPIGDFLALAEGLRGSRERAVLGLLVDRLGYAGEHLAGPGDRPRFDAWMRDLLGPAARELGGEPVPGEPDDRKALRALLFAALGDAGDPEALGRARRLVERALASPAAVGSGSDAIDPIDPSLADAAFLLAARGGDAALWDRLRAGLDAARTPEEAFRYLMALAAFRDPALVRRSLDLAFSPRIRTQDLPSLSAALLANPAARDATWAALKARWPELRERVVSFGGRGAVAALGSYCSAAAADEIARFFAANPAPGAERTLQRSLESIRACVQLEELQGERFRAWLAARPEAK